MNAALGSAGVTLGLVCAVLGAATMFVGVQRRQLKMVHMARQWMGLMMLGAIVCVIAMERGLITRDFSMAFVARHGSSRTPALFNIATMWSALEGSIILWTTILCGYGVAVMWRFRKRLDDALVGWAMIVMFIVSAFFFAMMLGPADPFRELSGAAIPLDGPGPNPLLQNHILMAFHPPMLYLGYVGFTVPFAFAIAALATGRVGEGWLAQTRRWTLFAWGFLTCGIILGAWWSYEVLGWGGVWAWDPVENASFLPWLTATAFIHSVLVQERRGMLRVWNLSLLCSTFSLTILGTFLTRSGVIESVHAFSESGIGPAFLGFFGVIVVVSLGLIAWRGDQLRSPGSIDSPVSREGAFLANNLIFGAFAFVVLLGTVFPLIIEAIKNDKIAVGAPYFQTMTAPLGLALLFLMAIAPVLPWRKASAELLSTRLVWPMWCGVAALAISIALDARGFEPLIAFTLGGFAAGAAGRQLVLAARRQGWRGLVGRANGGMIVHIGVIVIAVALAASQSYAHDGEFDLAVGDTASLGGHTVKFLGLTEETAKAFSSTVAHVQIDNGPVYTPSLRRYSGGSSSTNTPSVQPGVAEDVYLALTPKDYKPGDKVRLRVIVQPLVVWLWIGGMIMAAGTVLSAWPGKRRRSPIDPVSAPIPGAPGGSETGADGADSAAGEASATELVDA